MNNHRRILFGLGFLAVTAVVFADGWRTGGCRAGQPANGVDPATNEAPAGRVIDQSSSSPVVTPDGGVIYGSYTRYNYARGHMFRFDAHGNFVSAYDFGWDSTPAIYPHIGTYSIVIKDNHYDAGSYCDDNTICPVAPPGPYYITQLDPNMRIQWQFKNTTTDSTHNNGFEWCINAPSTCLATCSRTAKMATYM
ncbi:MAG TPA: hypothetical protein VMH28_02250 [Candidatus Acidoferrales bacterium]|nr:hypothetical protein [Candidatus Acidoferrales bacterium]